MPIVGAACGSMIQLQFAAAGFLGQNISQMAMAIGNGVINSILSSATYTGTSTGLGIGAGSSTGKILGGITIGPTVGNLIYLNMTAQGLLGENARSFASAVGAGIANHIASAAIVTGASTIVGIGVGTGTIVGVVGQAVGAQIFAMMTAQGLLGENARNVADAVGAGVASAIGMSTVTTTITGAAVGTVPPAFPPIPSTGTDTGKIL